MDTLKFNERLKYYREKANISKSELSRIIGVSPSYITKLENGEKTNPSLGVQIKLANALKCSIDNLTGEKKSLREYVLQILLDNGFSLEEISNTVDIPIDELNNIVNGNPYAYASGSKLMQSLPNLLLSKSDNLKVANKDTTSKKEANIINEFEGILKDFYYSERIRAFKTITPYANSSLNKKIDSLTIEQINELTKLVSDYIEFQITKILEKENE